MKSLFRVFFISLLGLLLIACNSGGNDSGIYAYKIENLMNSEVNRNESFSGLVVSQDTKEFSKDESKVIKEIFVKEGDTVGANTVVFAYDTEAINIDAQKVQLEIDQMNNSIITNQTQINTLINERALLPVADQFAVTLEIQEREAQIRETEYNIKVKEVELNRLLASVNNAEVLAGIDGIIQTINETDQYDPYTGRLLPFMTILQTGTYRVKGVVSEMNVSQLWEGSPVSVVSRVDSSQVWNGYIESINLDNPEQSNGNDFYGQADEMTTSSKYPFYVTLDSTEGLFLGQHVHIVLGSADIEPREGVWIMGHFVVYDEDGSMKVWKADGDKAVLVDIVMGEMDPLTGDIQIVEGLTLEDYIVDPSQEINEGDRVTLIEEN